MDEPTEVRLRVKAALPSLRVNADRLRADLEVLTPGFADAGEGTDRHALHRHLTDAVAAAEAAVDVATRFARGTAPWD